MWKLLNKNYTYPSQQQWQHKKMKMIKLENTTYSIKGITKLEPKKWEVCQIKLEIVIEAVYCHFNIIIGALLPMYIHYSTLTSTSLKSNQAPSNCFKSHVLHYSNQRFDLKKETTNISTAVIRFIPHWLVRKEINNETML